VRAVCVDVEHLSPGAPRPIACDVSSLVQPDQRALDSLARLQLTARRMGTTIRLHHASPALVDLIELAGLTDVLTVVSVGPDVVVDREVEEPEQIGVDEKVHRGDGAV
jgi:ABC-type transporter Mla MlaB component